MLVAELPCLEGYKAQNASLCNFINSIFIVFLTDKYFSRNFFGSI